MARPRRRRRVMFSPRASYFKPVGIPLRELNVVELDLAEGEALRLKHLERMNQSEAAQAMEISQSTLHRTLKRAYEKLADAVVSGKAIRIE